MGARFSSRPAAINETLRFTAGVAGLLRYVDTGLCFFGVATTDHVDALLPAMTTT
jgi:hypothetical protein